MNYSLPVRFRNSVAGVLASAAFMSVSLAMPSMATVVVVHDVETMTAKADVIVHGRVFESKSVREDDRIITLTTVEVLEGLKGAKTGEVITLAQLGGELDGKVLNIIGSHEYESNEEMIFFGMNHKGRVISYGVGLGRFLVERHGDSTNVQEKIGDVVALQPGSAPGSHLARPAERTYQSVGKFKNEIRGYLLASNAPSQLESKLPLKTKGLVLPSADALQKVKAKQRLK